MTSPGRLQDRFFWERVNDRYSIYDRTRGAGCFGENFVATAVDGVVAEMMCVLMNLADQSGGLRRLQGLAEGAK